MPNRRNLSYDVVRTVAIAMVVMVHVTSLLVIQYETAHDATYAVANICNALGRAGAPMFLMLTGALLLDEEREKTTRDIYRKNLLSIVLLLLFWVLFYAIWCSVLIPFLQGKPADMALFRDYLLQLKGYWQHLWYIFMLVGAYIVIPVLRLLVRKENKEYILGLIVLSMIVQFGTQTAGVLTRGMSFTVGDFVARFHMEYITGYVPYLLIGWYLTAFPPEGKTRLAMILGGLAALIWIILSAQYFIGDIPDIRNYMAEMNTLPGVLYGIGVFTLITTHFGKRETENRFLAFLSREAFGIYVLHVVLLDLLVGLVLPYTVSWERFPLLYILIVFILDFTLSLLLSLGLSKIKGVRKLVRG